MTPGPDRPGFAVELETASERWSAGRVDEEAGDLAERIRRQVAGDRPPRVAHRFGLAPLAVVAIHAVRRAGARLAPLHPGWDADQVARFLAAVDPDLLVTDASSGPPGAGWSAVAGPGRDAGETAVLLLARERGGARRTRLGLPPGTDVLLSTSGTTGTPRIVCHSWDTLRANAAAAVRRNRFGAGDTWLATLAWAHVGGLAVVARAALVGGRIAFGRSRFDPADVTATLGRSGATHVSLVPAMLHAILDRGAPPPPSLGLALVGGAATPPALARRAAGAGWPVAMTYGLTEMGSQVATGEPGDVPGEPGLVGPPLDGVELRIGPDGEIETRGPSRSLGSPGRPLPPHAWVSTGDLGELDAAGRLRVTGRRADRIVTGGANVDPADVEAALSEHPGVREVCVVGTPDAVWGEIVTAVVVATRPPPDAGGEAPPELREWADDRLSGPRRPRRWRWVESLPRGPGGKVDRARVRRLASEREGAE